MIELARKTMLEAAEGLRRSEWSSRELTQACLDVAQKQAPRTAAYVAMAEREALFAADESDRRRSSGGA
ncbi:MAG: Asp-tRNA(Asn)/Glu-tRNA(Gln) amidotransferase GatCAB subunit A, partial [Patescibacteria group bacterium]|nr:Asp-tRNA(Asn)/Glu-tRNA(Gln) amidotransferase GatCAB subunit A [Patescibacteria group bacterium]